MPFSICGTYVVIFWVPRRGLLLCITGTTVMSLHQMKPISLERTVSTDLEGLLYVKVPSLARLQCPTGGLRLRSLLPPPDVKQYNHHHQQQRFKSRWTTTQNRLYLQ